MISDERGKLGGLQFGSSKSSLFGTGCADPRDYVGPPVMRRCRTPSVSKPSPSPLHSGNSSNCSQSRDRKRASTPKLARYEGLQLGGTGEKSLLNLDPNQTLIEGTVLLDSPRSVEACLTLGLNARDFLNVSLHDAVEQMQKAGEDVSDMAVCRRRFEYLSTRRQQKLKAAQDLRMEIINKELKRASEGNTSGGPKSLEAGATLMDQEERRLQKIVDNNTSRLRQQLLHRELLQRQREKEDQRLDQQRRNDEQRKREQQMFLMEKSRKEEEAQRLRNEARELERRQHQAMVEIKRAMYEDKDLRVKQRIHDEQLRIEAANEAKHIRNMERRKQMKEQADQVLKNRRAQFQQRWVKFEQSREEYGEKLKTKAAKRHADGQKKQEKIESAIDKCEAVLQAKINKTYEKEARAIAKLHEFKDERDEVVEQKRRRDEMNEQHRKEIFEDAILLDKEKTAALKHRIMQQEQHLKLVGQMRAAEARLKHEEMMQKELDKADCVRRQHNVDMARREHLEEMISTKNERIDILKAHQSELGLKRKMHREEVERSRVHIPDGTPGPGDYLVTNGDIGQDAPKWKFGLPATVMSLRVLSRERPAPGYEASPGPCRYQAKIDFYSRHSRSPTPFFGKHDRWDHTNEGQTTPGPADYAPPGPPVK